MFAVITLGQTAGAHKVHLFETEEEARVFAGSAGGNVLRDSALNGNHGTPIIAKVE